MFGHFYQSLNPPVLVFVQSKERAKELYGELAFDDIRVDVLHSDLSQKEVFSVPLNNKLHAVKYEEYGQIMTFSVAFVSYFVLFYPSTLLFLSKKKNSTCD